ncbi:LytR C-terminal domain-containing protein [Streptomyces orinoci]|uniref:LytR C-terminal domain-containing protein n=1 Tax=Streptomyces orinoci TaxID=67339 RepID=A0ABV3JXV4_STRON|nr:LytR C-terminal domain-containing protein [Streptomyces orinoci]
MSMLTPPGMGGKYRITGQRFPHMRRTRSPRRVALAASAAAVVLGLGAWGTAQLVEVFSGGPDTTDRAARHEGPCARASAEGSGKDARLGHGAPREEPLPRPEDITVNVYNATARSRLAQTTAEELKQRGFKIGKVGNAPEQYDKKVPGTALLLGSPDAAEGPMKVLGEQLGGAEVKSDVRKGEDIDLIIGDAFKELPAKPGAATSAPPSGSPRPSPSPSASKC